METTAKYFDGKTARDRTVLLRQDSESLVFKGDDTIETRWTIAGLHAIDSPTEGQPFRLTHDDMPGARLVLRDAIFISALIASNKHLHGGYTLKHLRDVAVWTAGGLAVLAVTTYLTVAFLPQYVARVLPDDWRNRVGEQIVDSVVEGKKPCSSKDGDSALAAMIAALAAGNPDLPPISVRVYDLDLVNAFAAPGGKIIFTRGILGQAAGPDEIAGVLAHEIGHVAHLHPEAQMVRLTGLQVLISAATGTNGGDYTSNIAALAALLRYSRDAEREADSYARTMLENAAIDPLGLKRFFEKLMKMHGITPTAGTPAKKSSVLDRIGNVFSTHPGTEDRIKEIQALPSGKTAVKVLTPAQWLALQEICKT